MGGQVIETEAKRILDKGREGQRKETVIRMLDLGREPREISDFTGEDYFYVQETAREWQLQIRQNETYNTKDE